MINVNNHDLLSCACLQVVTLMGTDLVRHKDRWALGVKEMRDIFVRLESEGYTKEAQQVCVFGVSFIEDILYT